MLLTDYSQLSPEELHRRREIIDALRASAVQETPSSFGEGLSAIGRALFGRIGDQRLSPHEDAAREAWRTELLSALTGFGGGSGFGGSTTPAPAPQGTPEGFGIDPAQTVDLHGWPEPAPGAIPPQPQGFPGELQGLPFQIDPSQTASLHGGMPAAPQSGPVSAMTQAPGLQAPPAPSAAPEPPGTPVGAVPPTPMPVPPVQPSGYSHPDAQPYVGPPVPTPQSAATLGTLGGNLPSPRQGGSRSGSSRSSREEPPAVKTALSAGAPEGYGIEPGSTESFRDPRLQASPYGAIRRSLSGTESGGRLDAYNNERGHGGVRGHGGRLQFGAARLQDAARAGVIPPMSPQEYARAPAEVQDAVEAWHFRDIDQQTDRRGLDRYVGQDIDGPGGLPPITRDAIRAMAHLGGMGGAERFLHSGGQHDPEDVYGTSLSDYAAIHGGAGGRMASASSGDGARISAMNAPGGGFTINPEELVELMELMDNPYAPEGAKAVLSSILGQQIGMMDPESRLRLELLREQVIDAREPDRFTIGDRLVQEDGTVLADFGEEPSFRPATPEEAAAYGAEGGQIDTDTGRFYPTPGDGQDIDISLTTGQEAVDKEIAGEWIAWTQGGGAEAASHLAQIEEVAAQLEAIASGQSEGNLTGKGIGVMTEYTPALVPEATAAREQVERVINRNLRLILGSAFTEGEGKRVLESAYNPHLDEAENAKRLRYLLVTMRAALEAKASQMAYFEQHGTLAGWQGQTWTTDDIIAEVNSGTGSPSEGGSRRRYRFDADGNMIGD